MDRTNTPLLSQGSDHLHTAIPLTIYAASNSSGGRLIPGSGPITEQQIGDKLTADGFSNIQITLNGSVFETVATKEGRQAELAIDAQSGIVRREGDDDDDD